MAVALSEANADSTRPQMRQPWLTRERITAVRRPLTTLVVGLILWEVLARTVLTNRLFFAAPSDVAVAAMRLWESGELERHIRVSFSEVFYGVLLAVVVGTAVGVIAA